MILILKQSLELNQFLLPENCKVHFMIKNVSPKKKISKKSRYHSMKALEIIRKIEEKYSSMSNISVLSEEQLAWLKQSVIEFNQHIDETRSKAIAAC